MNKLALIVLDGWGFSDKTIGNAIREANTPFFDKLIANFPNCLLQASEEYVGLDHGQIGGSEVGHLTIGSGRVIFQDAPRISLAFQAPFNSEGSIAKFSEFQNFLELSKHHPAHLIGMVSKGGIHSRQEHLHSIISIMKNSGCLSPYIHFISDGRDSLPNEGMNFAKELIDFTNSLSFGKIVTLVGRFYAMDRDKNYDRTQLALNLYLNGSSDRHFKNILDAFNDNYIHLLTDELQLPTLLDADFFGIQKNEPLFFFNFRSDRMKQIVTSLAEKLPSNQFFTLTQYDKDYPFQVIFKKQIVNNTLGEVISKANLKQLRTAETDKIPHVTYFFNGGREIVFDGEIRDFAESTKVTYDQTPQMRAKDIVNIVINNVASSSPEFCLINFANADLVAHFGKYEPTLIAIETIDTQLSRVCEYLVKNDYICVITSDHGHAEDMYDFASKQFKTAHTLNPVPFIIYDPKHLFKKPINLNQDNSNSLSHIAATVLELMTLSKNPIFDDSLLK